MKISNHSKQTVIAKEAITAFSFTSRMRGLLGRRLLAPDEALILNHCNCIHMMFMQFPIDVIFLDKNRCVVGCVKNIKPFRLSPFFSKAFYAVEVNPGIINVSKTEVNDKIEWHE